MVGPTFHHPTGAVNSLYTPADQGERQRVGQAWVALVAGGSLTTLRGNMPPERAYRNPSLQQWSMGSLPWRGLPALSANDDIYLCLTIQGGLPGLQDLEGVVDAEDRQLIRMLVRGHKHFAVLEQLLYG